VHAIEYVTDRNSASFIKSYSSLNVWHVVPTFEVAACY